MHKFDVVIIGAGAAGLMCAIEAGKRGRKTLIIERANKPGKKILMSGGGRCNFTNREIGHEKYLSHNEHFCKSALKRYTQWDFLNLVSQEKISYQEKKHGQFFCSEKAKDILSMLLKKCEEVGTTLHFQENISQIIQNGDYDFHIISDKGKYACRSLVVATGGLSIPTLGSSPFGYEVAKQFNINIWPVRAGLVPLTYHYEDKERFGPLSGISAECIVTCSNHSFRENILFTHRGLSGPAILQISNYWQAGENLIINLLPDTHLVEQLKNLRHHHKLTLKELLYSYLPKRLVSTLINSELLNQPLQNLSHSLYSKIADQFHQWHIKPNGTEGYRTAEVTLGGVDCNAISSKTMEVLKIRGLYFIGEVLDVTGWLGGYNFQWAWSSGWAAGQYV